MEVNQNKKETNGCLSCLGCFGIIFLILLLIGGCSAIFSDDNNNDNTDKISEEKNKSKKTEDTNKNNTSKESKKKYNENEQSVSQNNSIKKSEEKDKDNDESDIGTTNKIPVKLGSTVDGDTAKFIYKGKTETYRFLLIDTPETKHPRVGKQPFGQEASDRTAELLNNAKNIEIEFDIGQKEDKYNRKLAYIYVDGEMLNNILVKEGLAKVAYVYPPNTRYLETLESSQEQAKAEKMGIWSLDSAFKEDNEDNKEMNTSNNNENNAIENQVDNSLSNDSQSNDTEQSTSNVETFPNCTALRKVHPNGVPSNHPAYTSKFDRDGDNYACEVN